MNQIAGIISPSQSSALPELEQMMSTMTLPHQLHDNHSTQFENFVFASNEREIFSNPQKTLHLVFDGLLYNIEELRDLLEKSGQKSVSSTPHEVVLLAYQTWGIGCLKRFNGPFVLAILDTHQKKMIVARDRLGSKNLYWGHFNRHILFASQLKGILASKWVAQHPDTTSIASYFYLGYFAQDKTPIVNVNRLLPGCFIEIDSDYSLHIDKYWDFKESISKTLQVSQEEFSFELHQRLKGAIKRRLPHAPNPCSLLTGDSGSTAMTLIMSQELGLPLHAMSTGFDNYPSPSLSPIQETVKKLGLHHTHIQVKEEDLISNLQHVVWHLDEPVSDPLAIALWLACEPLKKLNTSIFSAIGSTEFLEYPIDQSIFRTTSLMQKARSYSSPFFSHFISTVLGKFSHNLSLKSLKFFQQEAPFLKHFKQQFLFSKNLLNKIAPQLKNKFNVSLFLQQSYTYLKLMMNQQQNAKDYLFFDAETMHCNRLLIQYNNLLSSSQLKVFCPFLDNDVTDYLFAQDFLFSKEHEGSLLDLSHISSDFQATTMGNLDRQSPHFLSSWLKNPLIEEMFVKLSSGSLVESEIIDSNALKKLIKSKAVYPRKFEKLWSILILEIWFDLFVNNPVHIFPQSGMTIDFLKKT